MDTIYIMKNIRKIRDLHSFVSNIKGITIFFFDCNNTYKDEFNTALKKWTESLDYAYKAEDNIERFIKDEENFIDANLDRKKWCNRMDIILFKHFVDFYDDYLNLN
ncbi:hypothetical protein LQU94_05095 [Peptoniphilus sp. KCTC 25270]|uniref:hypothetical protein n=1 Tax=Peptoniphilus sp. KCTC 25270 TaxID=2897414 RepID=UPI001E4DE703|nr:hypothetical protein [Peptoniphilus sp. KCTC 25270]MCD1147485.1 hypothetical protein [Peptoniphilus sp. KCTC 25270]